MYSALVTKLSSKKWVVYAKPPFGGAKLVLNYLGRYIHRVAISHHRIVTVTSDRVTFLYRDRTDNDGIKEETITPVEFLRRFLLHVLPKDFMKIRSYGFLANRCKKKDLKKCRELLHVSPLRKSSARKTTPELLLELIGYDMTRCPCCHGTMRKIREIAPMDPRVIGDSCIREPPSEDDTS